MKKLLMLGIFTIVLAIPTFVHGATSTSLYVNGKLIDNTIAPFVKNDTTYVPLNEIATKMGDSVSYDAINQSVTVQDKNNAYVHVMANSTYALVSGKASPLKTKTLKGETINSEVPAIYQNEQMYVPIEFIEAEFGLTYDVEIIKKNNQTSIYVGTLSTAVKKTLPNRTYAVKVNNVAISSKYSPFVQNNIVYVPLTAIVQKMNGKPGTTKNQTTLSFATIYGATIKTGATIATIKDYYINSRDNTHTTPLAQTIKKGKKVDLKAKSIYKNEQLYVPLNFLGEDGLQYYVQTVDTANKTTIYVGELPAELATSIKQYGYAKKWALVIKVPGDTTNITEIVKNQQVYVARAQGDWYKVKVGSQSGFVHKDSIELGKSPATGKMYSDGWFAPTIKSALTNDPQKNYKILENELGFTDGTSYSIFGGYGLQAFYTTSKGDLTINVFQWENKTLKQSYRIPIVAKELFKFYFGKDGTRVYNYFVKNDVPEKFKANGKTVTAGYDPVIGALYLNVHH